MIDSIDDSIKKLKNESEAYFVFFYFFSLAFSIPVAQKSCGKRTIKEPQPTIVGGRNASEGEFPWQVSIGVREFGTIDHVCGGSILSANTILTAGHCVAL